ncbi:hypothetical protein [Streptomyces sp. RKAG293]|uniref:hypothetical protein n=1 Tax=Streptomyces sp. RKAG293 TaxID=2893403 RepID=UPI002033C24C|nr:hypothetical protein [Streptomyces sp. RKAG293]MCM2417081.1 hypothetical protein [Streptomyces sp. RKAG293]
MLWELRLLEQAERVGELAEEHHDAAVGTWVVRWFPDPQDAFREFSNPCPCVRIRLGAPPDPADLWWSADPAARQRLDAELQEHLIATGRRRVIHFLRTANAVPPTP